MSSVTLREHMTRAPHTIGDDQTLATAQALMQAHRIRHLPVVRDGKLVGLLSERDLLLASGLPGVDPTRVLVAEAMSARPIALSPATSLEWVVAEMAQLKIGSVVVVEDDEVVGVLTCVDALRALEAMLRRARRRDPRATPSRPPKKS